MKRVLVADDSMTARMFILRCLEIVLDEDTEYYEAANGEESLQILKDEEIDLVVTDLNMPVMDGFVLLRRLKASPKLIGTPVIIITSLKNEARKQELMDLGALAVLGKPASPPQLAEVVDNLFNSV